MSETKILLKNVSSLSLVQVANLILPLISIPIISRILGPDKFGVINYAATFVGYFNLLIDYGFNLTATRRVAKDPSNASNRNTVYKEVLSVKIILFFVSLLLFSIAVIYVGPLSREKTVALFSFFACIGTLLTQNWLFQAMQNLSKVAMLNFISRLLFTVLVLLVVRQKSDYVFYPLLNSLVTVFIAVVSLVWAYRLYKLKFSFAGFSRVKEILWNEKMVFFSTVVISLYTTTNVVLLGLIQSDTQVGIFTAAQRLTIMSMSIINIPLTQTLYPFIGKAFSESKNKGLRTVHKFIPLVVFFTGIIVLGMFLFGPIALHLLYGEAFSASVQVFRILCILPLVIGLSNAFGVQIMLNSNMDKLFFYITSTGALVGLVCNIVFTYYWGNIGTAINWVLTECFITLAMYFVLKTKNIKPVDFSLFRIRELRDSMISIKNGMRK